MAILVGRTGLVPEKIENFGITFAVPERKALLWVFVAVVVYYMLAFVIYSISDALRYGYTVYRGRQELQRQSEEVPVNTIVRREPKPVDPWRYVNLVTPASVARGLFDFLVPVLVAAFAIWSLWGAVHQVAPKASATPGAPVAVPSLKAR